MLQLQSQAGSTGRIDQSMLCMFWLLIIQSPVHTEGSKLHKHQQVKGSISQAEQTNIFSGTQHTRFH